MEQNTMEHHSGHPILTILLMLGAAFGVAGLQDVDIILAIVLKIISIASFLVATGYGIWKWNKEYRAHKRNQKHG